MTGTLTSALRYRRCKATESSSSTASVATTRSITRYNNYYNKKNICSVAFVCFVFIALCLEYLSRDILFSEFFEAMSPFRFISNVNMMGSTDVKDGIMPEQEMSVLVYDEDNGADVRKEDQQWDRVNAAFRLQDAIMQNRWYNERGLVHVIHSPFLQNQPRLLDFTMARLKQFQTFSLPSIFPPPNMDTEEEPHNKNQRLRWNRTRSTTTTTAKNNKNTFLWILWTDPSLLAETEKQIKIMIQDLPNVVVIGYKGKLHATKREGNRNNSTNGDGENNFENRRLGIRSPWFRETFDQSYIVAGSYRLIMNYHRASLSNAVLDTYLDANDAFSLDFVEALQEEASMVLAQEETLSFRLWCPPQILEWSYVSPKWYLHRNEQLGSSLDSGKRGGPRMHSSPLSNSKLNEGGIKQGKGAENDPSTASDIGFFTWKQPQQQQRDGGKSVPGHSCYRSSSGTSIGFSANATEERDFPFLIPMNQQPKSSWHRIILMCESYGEANCLGFVANNENSNNNKGSPISTSRKKSRLGQKREAPSDNQNHAKGDKDNGIQPSPVPWLLTVPSVFRSKTITAAQTKSIAPGNNKNSMAQQYGVTTELELLQLIQQQQESIWTLLPHRYGISKQSVIQFQIDSKRDLDKVLLDMLIICMPSDACKPRNKKVIQDLLSTVGLKKPSSSSSSSSAGNGGS